jgi:hypothetical protein
MYLHDYPRTSNLRGCAAVTPDQGGDSVCIYKVGRVLQKTNQEADVLPLRYGHLHRQR